MLTREQVKGKVGRWNMYVKATGSPTGGANEKICSLVSKDGKSYSCTNGCITVENFTSTFLDGQDLWIYMPVSKTSSQRDRRLLLLETK